MGSRINLHKALKIKNRLAGELSRLRGIAQRENSKKEGTCKVDMPDLYRQIQDVWEKLIEIKTRLAEANIGIYRSLETMAELKTSMAHLNNLNVSEGEEKEHVGLFEQKNGVQPKVYKIIAYKNQEIVDQDLKACQLEINRLQDEVDDYNAKTTIAWDE